jgi:hypothetical protein
MGCKLTTSHDYFGGKKQMTFMNVDFENQLKE